MGQTQTKWRGNQLAFEDGTTHETVKPVAPRVLIEDFEGDTLDGNLWTSVHTTANTNSTPALTLGAVTCEIQNNIEVNDCGVIGKNYAADTDWFVLTGNMKNLAYTLVNTTFPGGGVGYVTATQTKVAGEDTNGELDIVGTDVNGDPATDTIIPNDGATVVGTQLFRTIVSITGSGWIVDGGADIDQIVIGCTANVCAFTVSKGLIFETRLAVTTNPSDQVELLVGLMGNAYATNLQAAENNDIPIHAFFVFDGSAVCKIFTDDEVTDNDAVATGHSADGDYHVYKIDFTDPSDVMFYVDGAQVAKTTTFDISNASGNLQVAPYCVATKAGGNGVIVFDIDYIKVWQAER
jgi:hypothetical protein